MISVIMSVYNGEQFLVDSIESILNQTYRDFEFIIVNDGSKDNSLNIIHHYASLDNRIVVVSRENRGLIYSLNEAISHSQRPFIARMDADDIAEPLRFQIQLDFIQKNSHIDVVGSDALIFSKISESKLSMPKSNFSIESAMLFSPPIIHPSVLIRRNSIEKYGFNVYDEKFKGAEDYELWIRLFQGANFHNIPKVLLKYRQHSDSVTQLENKSLEERHHVLCKIYSCFFQKVFNVNLESRHASFLYAISMPNRFSYINLSKRHIIGSSFYISTLSIFKLKFNVLFRLWLRLTVLFLHNIRVL